MKQWLALLLCLSFFLCTVSCNSREPKNANKTITYVLEEEPRTLDPQIAQGSSASVLIGALYEGLVRLDETGKPIPGAAARWTANAGNTEFTFTLREGACWGNREQLPLRAEDFVYAFQRALLPETGSEICEPLFCIKNARAVNKGLLPADQLGAYAKDSRTLVVSLEYPYENFPALTATPVFMPCNRDFFESTAGRYGLERNCLLGNGPFIIDGPYGWEPRKHINLKRSSYYVGEQTPLPSALVCTFGDAELDLSNPVALLTSGKADALSLDAQYVTEAEDAGCSLVRFEDTTWGLCFNLAHRDEGNPLQNLNIRRAFVQSLDRGRLLSHLPASGAAAENIVPPSATLFGENYRAAAGGPFYPTHADGAAALMREGVRACGLEEPPKVTVLCPDDPDVKLMVNEMITVWNNLFDTYFNMEPLTEGQLASRIAAGTYQLAVCPLRPDADGPGAVLSLFLSGSEKNAPGLQSAEYDALFAAAEQADGESAAAAYAEAERFLNEQCVFYPLYYENHYFACAPGVTGIVFYPYGAGVDFTRAGKDG